MKLNAKKQAELFELLKSTKVGDQITFDGFMKGLGEPVTAHVVEVEPNKFWQLSLRWNSVQIQSVVAELVGNQMEVDVLGV